MDKKIKKKNIGMFFLSTLSFIILGLVMGITIDEILLELQKKRKLTNIELVLLQTSFNLLFVWLIYVVSLNYFNDKIMDIQVSLAGLFFPGIFFSIQTNYFKNMRTLFDL